jgi:REP element-mobilizing transposase RayT
MILTESFITKICERGYWEYHACAAGPDHVHVILSSQHDPEGIRRMLKRWLGQELSKIRPLPSGATWWAECGSIRWIMDEQYFNRALNYVTRQRATKNPGPQAPSPPPP